MDAPSPYSPDRSLLHAVLVLLGGAGLVAGSVYLLAVLDVPAARWHSEREAEVVAERRASRTPGPVRRPRRSRPGGHGTPLADSRVPAWAGAKSPAAPPIPPASSPSYFVEPDLGHAQIGAPSPNVGAPPSGGAAIADAGGPTGGAPQAGSAPLTPDLGGGSSGPAASGSGPKAWRSEARALASRSRALSRELGRLDRNDGASTSNATAKSGRRSGTPATASSGAGPSASSGPGTPDDPSQVPLGGAEWLAAAGAAYALNRLRDDGSEEADDEG